MSIADGAINSALISGFNSGWDRQQELADRRERDRLAKKQEARADQEWDWTLADRPYIEETRALRMNNLRRRNAEAEALYPYQLDARREYWKGQGEMQPKMNELRSRTMDKRLENLDAEWELRRLRQKLGIGTANMNLDMLPDIQRNKALQNEVDYLTLQGKKDRQPLWNEITQEQAQQQRQQQLNALNRSRYLATQDPRYLMQGVLESTRLPGGVDNGTPYIDHGGHRVPVDPEDLPALYAATTGMPLQGDDGYRDMAAKVLINAARSGTPARNTEEILRALQDLYGRGPDEGGTYHPGDFMGLLDQEF